jgi:hypothetical protein
MIQESATLHRKDFYYEEMGEGVGEEKGSELGRKGSKKRGQNYLIDSVRLAL